MLKIAVFFLALGLTSTQANSTSEPVISTDEARIIFEERSKHFTERSMFYFDEAERVMANLKICLYSDQSNENHQDKSNSHCDPLWADHLPGALNAVKSYIGSSITAMEIARALHPSSDIKYIRQIVCCKGTVKVDELQRFIASTVSKIESRDIRIFRPFFPSVDFEADDAPLPTQSPPPTSQPPSTLKHPIPRPPILLDQ